MCFNCANVYVVETKTLGQNIIAVDRSRIKCNLFFQFSVAIAIPIN